MTKFKMVPVEPNDAQCGETARDIVMWWSFSPPTGDALYKHLRRCGRLIPSWLPDLIADRMYVPPKGAVAAAIYRAMLDEIEDAPTGVRFATFEEAWDEMKARGYQYDADALEAVRLGWNLATGDKA